MNKAKIPRVIHYCWFGGGEKTELVLKCIESWKKYCPDYVIKEWNETNFDVNINDYVKEAYEKKKWAFVSDYARLVVVYKNGGVYLDTDVELIKNIDDVLSNNAFYGSDGEEVNTGLGFGAVKGDKSVKKMLEQYEGLHFVDENGKPDTTPCPIRNTNALKEFFGKDLNLFETNKKNGVIVYPPEYFSPLDYDTHKMKITDNTYSIHWYGESWLSNRKKKTKKIKRIVARIIGKKNFLAIRRIIKGH